MAEGGRTRWMHICAVCALCAPILLAATAVAAHAVPAPADSGTAIPSAQGRSAPATPGASPVALPVDPQTRAFRDELSRRQALLDELMAQLDALDRELSIATERYNAASERLATTRERVSVAEADLEEARSAYQLQLEKVNKRATSIYKEGSFAAVELLLHATSLSDLVSRVKFLNTLGISDADIARELDNRQRLLHETAARLDGAVIEAEALEFELRARQIEITLRINERQALLAEAQSDVLELLDAEAARRQREEHRLLRDILRGASSAGIVVEPGSPVETALAYHGIPYLWGGKTPAGFDCSGLVYWVFKQHGVRLPHYSGSQFRVGERVVPAALQPGDAVFFGSPIHHVGIYLGADYYIHAPRTGDFVRIARLSDRRDYAGARRYAWVPRTAPPLGAVIDPARVRIGR